jgi:hypothetical protein
MKISVIVHPNSKKPRVVEDLFHTIHIYVSEPPLEGKANKAVIEVLAKKYNVPKFSVRLISGEKSKSKMFEIKS